MLSKRKNGFKVSPIEEIEFIKKNYQWIIIIEYILLIEFEERFNLTFPVVVNYLYRCFNVIL